jgi:hypothetical protein
MGANKMTTWSPSELERVGAAEELRLASPRRDGNLSRYVTMWVVRAVTLRLVPQLAGASQE